MKDFNVWVPLLTEAMGQPLVGRLVAKGLRVESALSDGLCEDGLLCLQVGVQDDDTDNPAGDLHDLIKGTLNELGASHYGVIVVENSQYPNMWWSGIHIQEASHIRSPTPTALDILMEEDDL